jgi:dienelactone hydrolase
MLTGRRPFQGDSHVSTRLSILRDEPPPLTKIDKKIPGKLEHIVLRCLEKQKESRYSNAAGFLEDLRRFQSELQSSKVGLSRLLRQPRIVVPAAAILLTLIALGAWLWTYQSRLQWARHVALPEIERLVGEESYVEAYHLAREVEDLIPEDPEFQRLWSQTTQPFSWETDPPGVDVYWKGYANIDDPWVHVGQTPLEEVAFPAVTYLRWKFTKDGFEPVEIGSYAYGEGRLTLVPLEEHPSNMIRVSGGSVRLGTDDPVSPEDYWLDKYEVTNRQFKEFVDAGGYQNPDYWKHSFNKEGREIVWAEAMVEFVDTTGRPGPSTWELGDYPEGEDDFPVRGVSWYEAAAYAEFAKKSLPTVYHWLRATDTLSPPIILEMSNFDGQGPAQVGSHQGLGPFGTYDMAGNVKEWCWNQTGDRRFILGGSWMEPVYMYRARHAQLPFERSPTYGFRCAKYEGSAAEASMKPVERSWWRDYSKEQPVGDDTFRIYESIYAYDPTELDAEVEPVEDSSKYWTKERVTFNAAYGNERMMAYLYLPVNTTPPYQTVVYYPGAGAWVMPSHEQEMMQYLDFIIRSGRVVVYPIYKGTFERRVTPGPQGPRARRDLLIQWFKDLARSVDYLETRTDIDRDKLAYYGYSTGATRGPIFLALEKRFQTGVFLAGGLDRGTPLPEVDPFHFVSRVTMPVLIINGREDFRFPLESSQKPLLRLLGTPEEDKRLALLEGGHVPPRIGIIKEMLDWLDRYLGPVRAPKSTGN